MTNINGIGLRLSGVQAHSSLGIGERLIEPPRRIYNKIRNYHASADQQLVLKIAVKAINDMTGKNGLVPTRLVLGVTPRCPIISTELPRKKERMELLAATKAKMNAVIVKRRIMTAITRNIPPAADRLYDVVEEVLVYSEKREEMAWPITSF